MNRRDIIEHALDHFLQSKVHRYYGISSSELSALINTISEGGFALGNEVRVACCECHTVRFYHVTTLKCLAAPYRCKRCTAKRNPQSQPKRY